MKTNFWKRAAALLLALVLCFACVGTASAAEDVSGKVYLISYPRDGDENYHTGSWGHDALYFRHGWKLSASDYLDVRAIGSYDAIICYCIEPGVIQNTGDAFSRMGEDFWENMPDFNDLMTPQQMKRYEELYHDPQLFFLLGKTLCVEHTTPEEYSRVMAPPPNAKESHER